MTIGKTCPCRQGTTRLFAVRPLVNNRAILGLRILERVRDYGLMPEMIDVQRLVVVVTHMEHYNLIQRIGRKRPPTAHSM